MAQVIEKSSLLSFRQGLQREFSSQVFPDSASRIINWQPVPDGGLRVRRKWQEANKTGLPATRKIRGIGAMPVHSGFMTPIRRQRKKSNRKSSSLTTLEAPWWTDTIKGSYLVAIVGFSNFKDDGSAHTATSAITVTPPAGWTSLLAVHGNDSPSSVSTRVYVIQNADERSGVESFTFSSGVRRAQVELQEWRGVATASAVDVQQVASGFSVRPDTGLSAATDVSFPKQVVLGVITARTKDKSIKQTDFEPGWYDFRDPDDPPQKSTGSKDEWLNMATGRQVIVRSQVNRFTSVLDATALEDDAKSRWVAALFSLKAKNRGANDKDYYLIDNANSATQHEVFSVDMDALAVGPWASAGTLASTDTDKHPLSFASGLGGCLITAPDLVDGAGRRNLYQWDGTLLIPIFRSPAARSLAFWRSRFWAGGSKDHPNRLWWSSAGDQTTWDDGTTQDLQGGPGFIDIGADSEEIYDICPANEGLLLAKRDSLFYLSGPTEQPYPAQLSSGTGQKGRCICAIPGGAIIAGKNHIWLWDGGLPKLISRALDDWWVNTSRTFVYTAYVNGLVYIGGADEDTCVVYDTESGVWWVDKPPVPLWCLYSWDKRELLGGVTNSTTRAVDYQLHPGGSRDRDEALAESFEAVTQQLVLGSPARPITPKWLHVIYDKRSRSAGHPPLNVTPIYDGVPGSVRTITDTDPETTHVMGNGLHRERVDVGIKGASAALAVQFKFDYTCTVEHTTMFDIIGLEFVYDVEEPR